MRSDYYRDVKVGGRRKTWVFDKDDVAAEEVGEDNFAVDPGARVARAVELSAFDYKGALFHLRTVDASLEEESSHLNDPERNSLSDADHGVLLSVGVSTAILRHAGTGRLSIYRRPVLHP